MSSFFPHFRCPPVWLLALGVSAAIATLVYAQGYNISWYKIAGGGGTSTGGGFTLNGTIGQHDASARISGGPYSLSGGFWPGIGLVQTPGSPVLSMANTGTNKVQILWPSPSTDWVLQQNTNLSSTNWVNNASPLSDDGDDRWITVTPSGNQMFFRLRKP